MHSTTVSAAALLLAALRVVNAQTFTDCNPLDKTCPSDPALGTTLTTDFTAGASSDWSLAAGTTLSYGSNGAEFTINTATDAPTISSEKYIFFGKVDAVVRAAPGTGIVSSFILESDDLDEIDWEWLGSTDSSVESNFFGKGNTTTYDRAVYENVATPIETWHTYTVDWTSAYIKWSIDGNLVRTLNYGDALALGGRNFPQTPMRIKMGNWVGCADAAANQPSSPTYGTCQWAGGPASFSQPSTMYVKNVTIQDYSCGSEYTYSDNSGSYQSITISGSCNGNSVSSSVSGASSVASSISSSSSAAIFAQTTSGSLTGSSTATSKESSTATSKVTATTLGNSTVATTMSTATGSGSGAKSTASTATTSSASSTTTNAPSTVSSSSATTMIPKKSKYGAIDVAVIALGLTLGYFVM